MRPAFHIGKPRDHAGLAQILEDRLYDYSSKRVGKQDARWLSRVVKDHHQEIVAGVTGWTWADACEITYLWVSEKQRRQGIGRRLIQAIEEEAARRKCRIVLIRTYSFQAPGFYEKCGYTAAQVIEGFPPGHRYYAFTKNLVKRRRVYEK